MKNKINVLFVCLGNICRSPMAEMVLKNLVNQEGIGDMFYIDSAGTDGYNESVKAGMYFETKSILKDMHIPYTEHMSRQMQKEDYDKFDFIIGMDDKNIYNINKIIGSDKDNKVFRLLDFTKKPRDIIDPWYYGNFDLTYYDIDEGCKAFIEFCKKKYNI